MLAYLFQEPERAISSAREGAKYEQCAAGFFIVAERNFYYSLALLASYPMVSEEEQKEYLKIVEANQQQMKIWMDCCRENFEHKYLLISAEMARISGQDLEAMELYDRAIDSAREHEFIQNEALANELAAKFWLAKGNPQI